MPAGGAQAAAARPIPPFDRRLLRELPAARAGLAGSVTVGLLSTTAVVAQALALARLLASAMPGAERAGRLGDFVLLAGALGVRGAAVLCGEVIARLSATAAKAELRERLLSASFAPPFAALSPGAIATLAGRGLDALEVYLGRCLPDLVLAASAPLLLILAVGIIDWPSAVVLAVVLGLFPLFGSLVGRASGGLATTRWREVERLGQQVQDVFAGLPVLRALGMSAAQRERIERANEVLEAASMKTLRVAFLSALVLDTLASVSVALVAVPLGLRLLSGSVHLSAALAVLIVAPEVFLPLRRASAEFHESAEGLAAAAESLAVIDKEDRTRTGSPRESPGGVPDPAAVPVAFDRVFLELPGRSEPVLDEASLVIAPGETVVLTAPNGAGKSTAALLLLGYLFPTRGAVRVGGADLEELDPTSWRARLAYLPEHPSLLAATLGENLRIANPVASDEELLAALERAGGQAMIEAFEDGLSTRLGEGGQKASAGERQRIALARILLRPASLYVLDEPTVHLDKAAEERVVEELSRSLCGKSALVITHRPALLAIADRVVTLEGGRFWPLDNKAEPDGSEALPTRAGGQLARVRAR